MKAGQKKPLSLNKIDFKGKNVFLRVDFNVPVQNGKILDTYRVDKVLPTLEYILEKGGRIVLASHLGRPKLDKDGPLPTERTSLTLKPVGEYLSKKHGLEVLFMEHPESNAPRMLLNSLKAGQVILLENLRFHPGEEACEKSFAKILASYTQVYINEGFGISHRHHASVFLLPKLVSEKGAGFLFQKEIEELDNLLKTPKRPFYVFLGGSKAEDKIPLLKSLKNLADAFFIGGRLSYVFQKAQGIKLGDMTFKKELLFQASEFMEGLKTTKKRLLLPVDYIVAKDLNHPEKTIKTVPPQAILDGWRAGDIGAQTLKLFVKNLEQCQTLFWNGPMGFFEKSEFAAGTKELALAVSRHKKAFRLVGGGHSALAVRGLEAEIDHVSTGGGASLQYLKERTLAGLESLTN